MKTAAIDATVLSFTEVPALLSRIDSILAAGQFDLSAVKRIDSAGLAFLLELKRRAAKSGKTLVLSGATLQLRNIARFFELEPLLGFADRWRP